MIVIENDGTVRTIYNDEMIGLLEEGEAEVARASHVEPDRGGWVADMSPVGGPKLGPFKLRREALDEEIAWLERNRIPSPVS